MDMALDASGASELGRRLDGFNARATGLPDQQPLRIGARDASGALVGGVVGSTWAGWLYVTILWVDEPCRGSGLGSRLMAAAEREAVARGCRNACLTTFSYQAGAFYERLGYEVFGRLEDYPEGESLGFLRKRLV